MIGTIFTLISDLPTILPVTFPIAIAIGSGSPPYTFSWSLAVTCCDSII